MWCSVGMVWFGVAVIVMFGMVSCWWCGEVVELV